MHLKKRPFRNCYKIPNVKNNLKKQQKIKHHYGQWIYFNLVLKKHLKNNKSRDPMSLANKLFKPNVGEADLKKSTVLKHRNYRGKFRVTILRIILEKLIQNDEYLNIDEQHTDSNVLTATREEQ